VKVNGQKLMLGVNAGKLMPTFDLKYAAKKKKKKKLTGNNV
jgi:hypothetical protein